MAGSEMLREISSRESASTTRKIEAVIPVVSKVISDVAAGRALPNDKLAQAVEEFDQDPVVPVLMKNAKVLIRNGESRLAFNLLRNVLLRSPDHPDALREMANCLREAGRLDEALKCFRALAKIDSSVAAQCAVAETLYLAERDEMALAAYREILKTVVSDRDLLFDVYKNVGNIHVRAADFEAAEEFYDKAYTIRPQSDVLLVNYGTLEIQRENHEAAIERFRAAVAVNPESDRAWVGLSLVHRAMGDLELAKGNIERALDINPVNRTAIRLSVEWSIQDQEFGTALSRLESYVAGAGSEDSEICFIYAKLLVQVGRLADARMELERVLALDPGVDGGVALAKALDRARSEKV
jgi:tetratricopeptide (TPR) repeat protein